MLLDSHAHLSDERFDHDLDEVLSRTNSAGVSRVLLVGETLKDAEKNLLLARRYQQLIAGAGLYPGNAQIKAAEEIGDFISRHHQELYAIGEVGLDFWLAKEEVEKEIQREVLRYFARLAKEFDLPLNVHSRSAGRQTIALLLEEGVEKVQMHGYGGKGSTALPGVEAGFFFSIPPSIVRSRQKQKLVYHLPLDCLLLESDSPVLGPDPEQRNEPANIVVALEAIARFKKLEIDEVRDAVIANSGRLYPDLSA